MKIVLLIIGFCAGISVYSTLHSVNRSHFLNFYSSTQFVGIESLDLHAAWTTMLKKYVSGSGKVQYATWKKDQGALQLYLKLLAGNEPKSSQSKEAQMAYWLNLYNASTIQLVLQNYPVKSILDIDGGKPWDRRFIRVGSQLLSLNDIEHTILRKRFKDARIHFAINCASISCPPLRNTAFQPQRLEQQLQLATRDFLAGEQNQLKPDTIELSLLFQWYREDFGPLVEFVRQYSSIRFRKDVSIRFREYDWALNE